MTRKTTIEITAGEIKKAIADSLKAKGYAAEEDDITLRTDYHAGGLFTQGRYYCSGATVVIEENIKEE